MITKNKFTIKDEPNYGVQANNNETGSSTKSIVTDIVDARIMTFKMRIKTDCIIFKKTNKMIKKRIKL